ncbi:hypothetical protein A2U01_0063077 [Trifolium medium]|uniref:Uncharacterized protein n=1 Tax=Trifolium medium TaxID=97028 RepID=A0A392RYZ8_9FABA|nr:hypothetical protein [Trifolium medium]
MGDKPITRVDLKGTAAFTTTLTALNVQIAALAIQLNNIANNNINANNNNNHNKNNLNKGG